MFRNFQEIFSYACISEDLLPTESADLEYQGKLVYLLT